MTEEPKMAAYNQPDEAEDECPADVPGAGHDPTPNGRKCRNCWAVLDV